MLISAKKEDLLISGFHFLPKKTALLRSFLILLILALILSPLAPILAQDENQPDGAVVESAPETALPIAEQDGL